MSELLYDHTQSAPGGGPGPALAWYGEYEPRMPTRRRVEALLVSVGLFLLMVGVPTSLIVPAAPAGAAAVSSVAGVQSLYASDLVARINAERAVRSSAATNVPQLTVDNGLAGTAQAWSAHLAAIGTVVDPAIGGCSGSSPQVCAFAANSGSSGSGYWPGDGSDGMAAAYMASTPHRQNELGAAYQYVGVGVTCAGGQAWTVELFGYAGTTYASANARQASQNATQGDPVPPTPQVAGTQTGKPVYCPGQTVGPGGVTTPTGGQYAYPYAVPSVPGEPGAGPTAVSLTATPDGRGYWVANSDGTVKAHGDAASYGSMAGIPLVAPVTRLEDTVDGKGYWMAAADGGVFSFGDARFYGSMGGQPLNAPVVGMAPTPDGRGYWLVAADGGVFSFGDARFYGSMGGTRLNQPIVGMAADPATGGYWLVAADGGVFSFNAPFLGSTGNLALNRPVVNLTATPGGHGYWLVASDGGVFTFGDARFKGSTGAMTLNAPVVGMAGNGTDGGYWLVGADGGVFSFGVPFYGAG